MTGGRGGLTLLLKRGFQPYACNAINARLYARFIQATQDPTHASNLTQAMSCDKFAVRCTLTYGNVVIMHFDFYGSVHTLRCRTEADGNAIVLIDDNSK